MDEKLNTDDFDTSDISDADNRTAAEHYIFGRSVMDSDRLIDKIAYGATGSYLSLGYQGAKALGFYSHASPASTTQLSWELKSYTDSLGWTHYFSKIPGACKCK